MKRCVLAITRSRPQDVRSCTCSRRTNASPILQKGVADYRTHINVVALRAGTSNEGGFRVSSDRLHTLGDRLVVADRRPRALRENCAVT